MEFLDIPSITDRAEYLKIHAHCLGYRFSSHYKEKYYIYDHLDYSNGRIQSYGFIVYFKKKGEDYLPVRIVKTTPHTIQRWIDVIGLKGE